MPTKHNVVLVILSITALVLLFHRYSSLLKFEFVKNETEHSNNLPVHNDPSQHLTQAHQHIGMESYSNTQPLPQRPKPNPNQVGQNTRKNPQNRPQSQSQIKPTNNHFTPQETLDQTKNAEGFFFLPGWEIPISAENQLFVDPREAGIHLYNQFSELVAQWAASSSVQCAFYLFTQMADTWVEKIGANGIIQVLEDAHNSISIPNDVLVYHSLGEWLYDKCPVSKWGVEVTATMKLHGAALHGAIWASIRNMQYYSDSEIIQYISKDTCFFNSPDLSMVYSACK